MSARLEMGTITVGQVDRSADIAGEVDVPFHFVDEAGNMDVYAAMQVEQAITGSKREDVQKPRHPPCVVPKHALMKEDKKMYTSTSASSGS